jgi:AAA domain
MSASIAEQLRALASAPSKSPKGELSNTIRASDDDLLARLGAIEFTPDWWERDDDSAQDWALFPLVPKSRGCSLVAPAGAKKSLLTLSLCASAVLGSASRPPVRVLYVDYEMTEVDVRERLMDMGYGPSHDLSGLVYLSVPDIPALNTREGGLALLQVAKVAKPDVIVLDTFSRAVVGPENDAAVAQDYYRHTGSPLKAEGIAVLRLDHTGKSIEAGARGSSAKRDDVDLAWIMSRSEGQDGKERLSIKSDKHRVNWVPREITMRIDQEPLCFVYVDEPGWPAGTRETAEALARLGVDPYASSRVAEAALKSANEGKKRSVVLAAIRFRKSGIPSGSQS